MCFMSTGLEFYQGKEKKGEERFVKRILISNYSEEENIQDKIRRKTCESDELKFYHVTDQSKIIEIVRHEKKCNVQLMVGIDDFKCKYRQF